MRAYARSQKYGTLVGPNGLEGYALRKIHKENANYVCVFVGPQNSGKTWAGLRHAEHIDEGFNEERIIFTPGDFLKVVADDKYLKRGDFILFDEAGVGISKRQWYSFANRAIFAVLQSFRFRGLGVIFTVPSLSYVDKSIQPLLHITFEMVTKDIGLGISEAKPKFWRYDAITGKVYRPYPRKVIKEQGYNMIKKLTSKQFKMPSKKLREAYEDKRKVWAGREYTKLHKQFEALQLKIENKSVRGYMNVEEKMKEFIEKFDDCTKLRGKKYLSQGRRIVLNDLRFELGISANNARALKKKLMKDETVKAMLMADVKDKEEKIVVDKPIPEMPDFGF